MHTFTQLQSDVNPNLKKNYLFKFTKQIVLVKSEILYFTTTKKYYYS